MAKFWIVQEGDKPQEIIESEERPKMLYNGGLYHSCSSPYESREALIAARGIPEYPCDECGGLIDCLYSNAPTMRKRHLCFTCLFWMEIIERVGDKKERTVIVNGVAYYREDFRKGVPSHCLGFGGSIYKIKMNNGTEYVTNNLWHQGTIPERFSKRLPNNAIFVRDESTRVKVNL